MSASPEPTLQPNGNLLYEWRSLSRGERLPAGAVMAGMTKPDGVTYAARFEGEAGKINLDSGVMNNFWAHRAQKSKHAEVLVCQERVASSWLSISRGEAIPRGAVAAGRTATDGLVYVGRFSGESGKIIITCKDGVPKMNMFWGHHFGDSSMAEILVIGDEPATAHINSFPLLRRIPTNSSVEGSFSNSPPRGYQCFSPSGADQSFDTISVADMVRWMWNDTWITLSKKNPLRWSKQQGIHATLLDLAEISGDQQSRPVLLCVRRGRVEKEMVFANVAAMIAALKDVTATQSAAPTVQLYPPPPTVTKSDAPTVQLYPPPPTDTKGPGEGRRHTTQLIVTEAGKPVMDLTGARRFSEQPSLPPMETVDAAARLPNEKGGADEKPIVDLTGGRTFGRGAAPPVDSFQPPVDSFGPAMGSFTLDHDSLSTTSDHVGSFPFPAASLEPDRDVSCVADIESNHLIGNDSDSQTQTATVAQAQQESCRKERVELDLTGARDDVGDHHAECTEEPQSPRSKLPQLLAAPHSKNSVLEFEDLSGYDDDHH